MQCSVQQPCCVVFTRTIYNTMLNISANVVCTGSIICNAMLSTAGNVVCTVCSIINAILSKFCMYCCLINSAMLCLNIVRRGCISLCVFLFYLIYFLWGGGGCQFQQLHYEDDQPVHVS